MPPAGFEPAIPESERPQTHTAISQNETYYFLKQQKRHGISNEEDVFSMKYKHNKPVSSLPRNRLKFSPTSSYTCANLWLMASSETKRVDRRCQVPGLFGSAFLSTARWLYEFTNSTPVLHPYAPSIPYSTFHIYKLIPILLCAYLATTQQKAEDSLDRLQDARLV
jgi:hypothetical protein